jgi:hypothetical protein
MEKYYEKYILILNIIKQLMKKYYEFGKEL